MLTLCALLSLLSGGCHSDTSPIGAQSDPYTTYPNITLSQPSLTEAVKFQSPVLSRTANNNMQVTVPVRGASNETLHLEYRVIWFDAVHRPLSPEMSWTPIRLEPRQPQQLTAASSSSDAVDYNLQVRWGKP
jgi:uncharacterized protein YcfL